MAKWTRLFGFRVQVGSSLWKWLKANAAKIRSLARTVPRLLRRPVTMYDSVTVPAIPANAKAVAGYVNGRWPTFPELVHRFPRAHRLSIAVSAGVNAEALDIERGDATIAEAPAWVKAQHKRGLARPVVYTSLAFAQQLVDGLAAEGIPRHRYRLWTAHYTGKRHRCSARCGLGFTGVADATQYTDRALGRNLDASLCSRTFF